MWKPEGKRSHGGSRRRRKDNIYRNLGVYLVKLASETHNWRAVVKAVTNIHLRKGAG